MAELATLQIKVDASGAIRVVDQFGHAVEGAGRKTGGLTGELGTLARRMAPLVGAGALFKKFIDESTEAQFAQARLAAALRATGESAGQSINDLNAHAAALQRITAFGDDEIGQAQARLLSYTGIAGKEFPRATQAVLDYAAAFGGDLVQAAEAVGKALNFPSVGMEALRKQGFILTAAQEELIEHFEETNQLARAQAIIFDELELVTAGTATRMRDTLGGALKGLGNAWGDLFEVTREQSSGIVGFVDGLTDAITDLGATWSLTWVEMDVAMTKAVNNMQNASTRIDRGFWALVFGGTRGAIGGGRLAATTGTIAGRENENAELDRMLDTLRREFTASRGARRGGTAGRGGESGAGLGLAVATSEELDAMEQLIRQHYADSADVLRNRLEDEDAFQQALADLTAQHHRDSAEAFAFRMDLEQSALERITSWAQKLQGWVDKLGLGGAFGGTFFGSLLGTAASSGVTALFGSLADAILGAGGAAREMARAFRESQASIDAFAGLAGESQLTQAERDLRDLEAQRDALVTGAFRAANAGKFNVGRSSGDIAKDIAALTRELERNAAAEAILRKNVGMNASARDALLKAYAGESDAIRKLLDQLHDIEGAFGANTAAAARAVFELEREARVRQVGGLTAFRDQLLLSGQSTLSPVAQLREAERQYELLLALARGGDASAIASIPESARAFLEASRSVNASGVRYAETFNRVTEDTNALIASLQSQAASGNDVTELILDVNQQTLSVQESAVAIAEAHVAVTQEQTVQTLAALTALTERVDAMAVTIKMAIEDAP